MQRPSRVNSHSRRWNASLFGLVSRVTDPSLLDGMHSDQQIEALLLGRGDRNGYGQLGMWGLGNHRTS
jgi:hypothetical protein